MKVTIAQLNPIVGDIKGNLQRIIQILAEQASGSDLIVFSELFLVGYPPKDLVERVGFIEEVERALTQLTEISQQYPGIGILVGAPLFNQSKIGKGLTNSAVLISNGQILLNQAKTLLPTYDVFDEARHFEPAGKTEVVNFKGEVLGISVCEDAWNDPEFSSITYQNDPIAGLVKAGATLLINISASPYYMGKESLRNRLIGNHARKHGIPFAFVNQIGGNDELIFDGGSMVFNQKGELIYAAPFFREQIVTVETAGSGVPDKYQPMDKIESVYQALVLGTKDYLHKCGFRQAVIGLSGGIDSALTACVAVDALGAENVLGISMPSPYSSTGSVEDSRELARNLGIQFKVVPISEIFNSYLNTLQEHFANQKTDVTEENIQARIRGNILMAFSNKYGSLALSTGNKSELAVGYCTLYGDMSGGLSVISDVPKTLVYQISNYINRNREIIPQTIIDKAPSAELKPDQKDEDNLPPYPVLDQILHYYIEEGYSAGQIIAAGFAEETVRWVIRTVDRNEYKRKQAAPGLKVTSKAFGPGRRMPVAKRLDV